MSTKLRHVKITDPVWRQFYYLYVVGMAPKYIVSRIRNRKALRVSFLRALFPVEIVGFHYKVDARMVDK